MMSVAVHIAIGVALAAGCAAGIISAGHLARDWRLPGLLDDRAGSQDRALGGVCIAVWMTLSFGPWLAGWNSTMVLALTLASVISLALAVRFLRSSSAQKREEV